MSKKSPFVLPCPFIGGVDFVVVVVVVVVVVIVVVVVVVAVLVAVVVVVVSVVVVVVVIVTGLTLTGEMPNLTTFETRFVVAVVVVVVIVFIVIVIVVVVFAVIPRDFTHRLTMIKTNRCVEGRFNKRGRVIRSW